VPLFTSGGLGLGLVILVFGLGLVSSGLGLGIKNFVLFTPLLMLLTAFLCTCHLQDYAFGVQVRAWSGAGICCNLQPTVNRHRTSELALSITRYQFQLFFIIIDQSWITWLRKIYYHSFKSDDENRASTRSSCLLMLNQTFIIIAIGYFIWGIEWNKEALLFVAIACSWSLSFNLFNG